jgi:hypothetical protein
MLSHLAASVRTRREPERACGGPISSLLGTLLFDESLPFFAESTGSQESLIDLPFALRDSLSLSPRWNATFSARDQGIQGCVGVRVDGVHDGHQMTYESSFNLVDANQFGSTIPGRKHQHSSMELRDVHLSLLLGERLAPRRLARTEFSAKIVGVLLRDCVWTLVWTLRPRRRFCRV